MVVDVLDFANLNGVEIWSGMTVVSSVKAALSCPLDIFVLFQRHLIGLSVCPPNGKTIVGVSTWLFMAHPTSKRG